MRQIKFRAWDEKLTLWEYWGLPEDAGYIAGRFNKQNATKAGRRFSTSTLTQFTGLHDKNGKEIYEGDIVKTGEETGEVQYNEQQGAFIILFYPHNSKKKSGAANLGSTWPSPAKEIIGNIYENPELLK